MKLNQKMVNNSTMQHTAEDQKYALEGPFACFEHLTGRGRGSFTWLKRADLDVGLSRNNLLHLALVGENSIGVRLIAHVLDTPNGLLILPAPDEKIWVNGEEIQEHLLKNGDMVEFGDAGPLSRFWMLDKAISAHHNFGEVVRDAYTYLRFSRQPATRRFFLAVLQVLRRLSLETTVLFRLGAVFTMLLFAGFFIQQYRVNELLQERIKQAERQIDDFARTLSQTRREALTPTDLELLKKELSPGIAAREKRLLELEKRSVSDVRIISNAGPAIAFLQGAYGFKEKATGRFLRHVLSPDGTPMVSPRGQAILSLDGTGPIAERQFTGTGFIVEDVEFLVTNRHIAIPWEGDSNFNAMISEGLTPFVVDFKAYFPTSEVAHELRLHVASETEDIALMRFLEGRPAIKGLALSTSPLVPGNKLLIVGYSAGLRSLLAQAGHAFVKNLQDEGITGFWNIATKLAEDNRIKPLASRGIAAQVGLESVVYDAETTKGGSGAPVLNSDGEVVAVNSEIIPAFGGSNIGVPVARLSQFIKDVNSDKSP